METRHAKRQRLPREEEIEEKEEEEEEQEEGNDDNDNPALALLPLPKWKRRRQLVREALSPSSGLFEDLYGVLDGYLGKMDVSELECVRTIGSSGEGEEQFQGIGGISTDDQHIAVSDYEANSISLFNKASGAFVCKLGSERSGEREVENPYAVCLDGDNMYVCDCDNHRVQVLTKEGVFVRFIGDASGDGKLNGPLDMAVDEQHVYVSNFLGNFISVFDKASGAFVRKFGCQGSGQGQLDYPYGMCLDGGNVYVCDTENPRVQVLTKEGVFVRFIGDLSGDGRLQDPTGVAVDEQYVFVADFNGKCIKVFTKVDGVFVRKVRPNGISEMKPYFLALSDGLLYATDSANQCIAVLEG